MNISVQHERHRGTVGSCIMSGALSEEKNTESVDQ